MASNLLYDENYIRYIIMIKGLKNESEIELDYLKRLLPICSSAINKT